MKQSTIYRLDSADLSWVFRCDSGLPFVLYCGPKLTFTEDSDHLLSLLAPVLPPGVLDSSSAGSLVPEPGRGFMEHPGILLNREGLAVQTQYRFTAVSQGPGHLEFLASDSASNTELRLRIEVDAESNVFRLNNSVTNLGERRLGVDWLAACSLQLPANCDEIGLFGGRWSHEFQLQRQRLQDANLVKENRRGRTSHQSFPALLAGSPNFSWVDGTVYAAHLGWSGNHRLLAARNRDSGHFLQLGELLTNGELTLEKGETYETPPAYLSASVSGMNPLMRNFHHFVRGRVLRPFAVDKPRPVHYNSWEACYFSQSEEKILQMISAAADLGVERFVIDDGWFQGRHDDTAGLGDWQVCEQKYPSGLKSIGQAIKTAGMEFGLWFEPEMVNENSELFRAHPEWVLTAPKLEPVLGRNQLALNLCLPEVFDHLLATLTDLVGQLELDYIKWDMNRDLTHVLAESHATSHELTLAFYRMARQLRRNHPDLEIEICSSGGARADYGALSCGDRLWPSDNHDILDKQSQREVASLFFPPEVLGNHVGASPDHHSGRSFSLAQRAVAAGMGHMGIEMDVSSLSAEDAAQLRLSIADYKENRNWLQNSSSHVLTSQYSNLHALLRIASDGCRARLYVLQRGSGEQAINPPLQLSGLDPQCRYSVTTQNFNLGQQGDADLSSPETTGELLLFSGLPLPPMQPDSWLLFDIIKTSDRNATS